jgi:SAM-dependent methyltransferase
VLDAGCGRGVGLIANATLSPDVDFLGVDLCARSLAEARAEVHSRGLANVRLQELDLMTLEGLDAPANGFDVILSSGVVHHLVDPLAGLRRLRERLAPHGVLALMVYGRHGREALYRVVRAIDALVPRSAPLAERLKVGRELVGAIDSPAFMAGPWNDQRTIHDSEFVDRYLNVHETSYDVPSLLTLIEGAGLEFLRWSEPADWDVATLLPSGPLRERALQLALRERWQLIDSLFWRPGFELLVCHAGIGPRAPFDARRAETEALCLSPEVTLHMERRNLRGLQRNEALSVRVRQREPFVVGFGPLAHALLVLEHQLEPFLYPDFVRELGARGVDEPAARGAIEELLRREVLYRPHLADL